MKLSNILFKLLSRLKLLRFLSLNAPLTIGKRKYKIPITKGTGYMHLAVTEPWMRLVLEVLRKYLIGQSQKDFVDVGVNVGQTLLMVNSIYPNVRYLGFEPNPVCVAYVQELKRINGISSASIFPVGLSQDIRMAELIFFKDDQADDTASVVENFREEARGIRSKVVLYRGDSLIAQEGINPGVIKIDVEGGELEVILGLQETIKKFRPVVLCEILPVYQPSNHFRINRQRTLLDFFEAENYVLHRIRPDGTIIKIPTIEVHSDVTLSNYLFVPKESPL